MSWWFADELDMTLLRGVVYKMKIGGRILEELHKEVGIQMI